MPFLLRRLLMIALCLRFPASVSAGALQQKLFTAKSYPGSRCSCSSYYSSPAS